MKICKLRLDTLRNVWVHEPSGIQVAHWIASDPAARSHDPTVEHAKASAARHFESRLKEPCQLVFLDEPFAVSGKPTEVRMTHFGGTTIPTVT